MDIEPFLREPPLIQIHAAAALAAMVIGPVALWRRSRDFWHKLAGYAWVLAMTVTALTSFWIFGFRLIGPFSPIHLLSLFVLWSLAEALWAIRHGNIARHQFVMRSLYFWALMITGLATLLPGRIMHLVVMPDLASPWNWLAVVLLAALLIGLRFGWRFLPLGKVRGLD